MLMLLLFKVLCIVDVRAGTNNSIPDNRMWVARPEGNNSSQMLAKNSNLVYNNPDNIKHSASEFRAAFALTKGV